MSELERLRVVIGYEFLKHIRRKRLWVILGLTLIAELAVLIGLPVLMDGYPDNIMAMAAILTIGPSMATIGAIFFAGDAIAGEFESKTGYILFTNPVRRITLLTGKYLASSDSPTAVNASPIGAAGCGFDWSVSISNTRLEYLLWKYPCSRSCILRSRSSSATTGFLRP